MPDYEARLMKARRALSEAEHILIGGGAGLSDAAGLQFTGRRFTDNFAPFIARYGFDDLYTSSFHPFPSPEEKWAYWAKHISINRYDEPATELYQELFQLVRGKEHFVLTTNVDGQFLKAGFSEHDIFAVQGEYGLFQCAQGCHDTLYDNENQVADMVRQTVDCKIPTELVPICPVCHGALDVHIRKDSCFVQDGGWLDAERRYLDFLRVGEGRPLALLELGVGFNTPGIIRFPFERLVYENPGATLIRVNRDHPQAIAENPGRTISFAEDMTHVVRALRCRRQSDNYPSGKNDHGSDATPWLSADLSA